MCPITVFIAAAPRTNSELDQEAPTCFYALGSRPATSAPEASKIGPERVPRLPSKAANAGKSSCFLVLVVEFRAIGNDDCGAEAPRPGKLSPQVPNTVVPQKTYFFTSGHSLSAKGRKACSAGTSARVL